MHDFRQRKDPPTDSETLTNTTAYAAPDRKLLRAEEHAIVNDLRWRSESDPGSSNQHWMANSTVGKKRADRVFDQ